MTNRHTAVTRARRAAAAAALGITFSVAANGGFADSRSGAVVADFSGHPPFKREWRSNEEIAELNARRAAETTASNDRLGPPGKKQFAARNATPEAVIFARFEEVDSRPTGRTWRGTPGKLNHRPR